MKIFTTGGCGFIGSNFVIKQILQENNTILNFDSLTYAGNKDNLEKLKDFNDQYTFIHADICDFSTLYNSIKDFNPDVVIHFAAESHVDRSIDNPSAFVSTNIVGTTNLLQASFKYFSEVISYDRGFKFIHISTDEVYGSIKEPHLFSESSPYNPSSPYSSSKAGSDHLVRSWFKTYGFPAIITNCTNNYGQYQFPEKLIPLIIANCYDEKKLPVYGTGNNIRDWLFVEDHCDALIKVINTGQIGETYCIGGNNEVKNIDIVHKICSIMDELKPRNNSSSYKSLIEFVDDRPGHDFRYAINSSKAQKELSWKPKESIDSGLLKTVEWYLNNESWWRKIQDRHNTQQRLGLNKK